MAERAWGTVREDYSAHGTAWDHLPHDHARSRAYRWNEDGLGGLCDRRQHTCFALALWNGRDPILKERLFGLTGSEGNHGEDVKECYYYLDSTPTHSFMRMLYKYPQAEFPYAQLVEENRRRGKHEPEFELVDTGVFAEDRYFDIFLEYAKNGPEDILIRIRAVNRGPDPAPLHLVPTVWFRNTWSWQEGGERPALWLEGDEAISLEGRRWLRWNAADAPARDVVEHEDVAADDPPAPLPLPAEPVALELGQDLVSKQHSCSCQPEGVVVHPQVPGLLRGFQGPPVHLDRIAAKTQPMLAA